MASPASQLPPLFLERLRAIYPGRVAEQILPTFAAERPTTFRVNTLHADADTVRRALQDAGFQLERVPWSELGYILKNRNSRALTETAVYRAGHIYVQSLSSMLPPLLLDPQPGETILDLTAAPGSKTTQMAALMRNQGKIVANDNNKPRFFKLMANVKMQGAACVECALFHGETIWRRYGEVFDRVLVDAPCSGLGTLRRSPDLKFRQSPGSIEEFTRKQAAILASASRLLKKGGRLVYATCSILPEENQHIVQAFLAAHPGFALKPAGEILQQQKIALEMGDYLELRPHMHGTDGFFAAVLERLAE